MAPARPGGRPMSPRPAAAGGAGSPVAVLVRLVGLLGLRPGRVAVSVGLGALAVVAGSGAGGDWPGT